MCMLCVEIQKKTMTAREVARAYVEVSSKDVEHVTAEIVKQGAEFHMDVADALTDILLRERDQ